MWTRVSLRFKVTSLVVCIVAVATYTLGRMMYNGLVDLLEKVAGLRAETVADALVDGIDGEWYKAKDLHSGLDDENYKKLSGHLERLIAGGYINRVELIRFIDSNRVEHFLGAPANGSQDYYPPGKVDTTLPGGLYSQRKPGHNFVELFDGYNMAGWTPVVLRDGTPVGLVVVYVDAQQIQDALDSTNLAILLTSLTLILVSSLASYKFAVSFERTAVTDGLMGIFNHKYFKQRLEEEVAKSRRYKQQTSLVMLDIDFFKRVNDTYGHATGDLVLKQLAGIVKETCRNTDVVARYGGEEIAVILTHTGLAGAQEFAERLRLKVSQHVVRDPEEDAEFRVTVSVGVTQWEKGVEPMDMIRRADAALYHSKETGRNRVTLYQEDLLIPPTEAQTKPKTR